MPESLRLAIEPAGDTLFPVPEVHEDIAVQERLVAVVANMTPAELRVLGILNQVHITSINGYQYPI